MRGFASKRVVTCDPGLPGLGVVADAAVVFDGERLVYVGPRSGAPAVASLTDVGDRVITPGLVDAHVHFAQTGWGDGRPDAFDVRSKHPYEDVQKDLRTHPERFFRSYVCSGVTSVFDVGGYAWSLDLPARAENDTLAPRVRALLQARRSAAGPGSPTWPTTTPWASARRPV